LTGSAEPRPRTSPWWLVGALAPMIASQILRLTTNSTPLWLAADYAGRLTALAVLAAIPAAREVAFSREPLKIGLTEMMLWIIGLVAFHRIIDLAIDDYVRATFPDVALGSYPVAQGWLRAFDLAVGLPLVAWVEEVLFRRCARAALAPWLGDGLVMVLATALLFAAYHWWSGLGNIIAAFLFGVAAMLFYRRAGMLAPVVLAHFLCDLASFA
jgi:membrane protease YdiL (CAAX protease family)